MPQRKGAAIDIENLEIASELREHIQKGAIGVAYQPIVDARTHQVVGVEALARWPQNEKRSISPDRFIGVAEEFGLIGSLGSVLLRKACSDVMPHRNLKLSINVSPLQISDSRFVPELLRILDECRFPYPQLEIELTEGILAKNPSRAKKVVRELQLAGIKVALDDFGAGYASIGYLRDFEFNKVKLDRTLTQAVERDASIQKIVQGTVLVASGLSAAVVAEGVETAEQAKLMQLAGCSQLQGYFFGRPDKALPRQPEADLLVYGQQAGAA
jgi:EAL domain-containing protein (putative c-di-GMP-specific phosphodiesterase class I)